VDPSAWVCLVTRLAVSYSFVRYLTPQLALKRPLPGSK